MPRYLFNCEQCDEQFSVFLNVSESCSSCSICGSTKITKIFKSREKNEKQNVVGMLMSEHIKETREEIEQMKKTLAEEGQK